MSQAAFSLDSIVSSQGFKAQKIVIYGVPGVGKTTFASTFPNPILIRTEDGAGALDVPTFPNVCESSEDITSALRTLYAGDHNFKTLIIDSLDWAEPLIWDEVCKENGVQNIESFGYGKGYVLVDKKWRALQSALDKLRVHKSMHVICIAHAVASIFEPPDTDAYMRYSLKLHKRAAAIWMEWAEQLLFVNYGVQVRAAKNEMKKSKATGTGERIIYTAERPAYQAKTRWPLPEQIFVGNDPTWAAYHEALHEATNGGY